ncbi:MAG: hypothetical protein HYV96_02480 [Opitutae bacterium]|nr:hypothetical protein [Opitutae bacterium]
MACLRVLLAPVLASCLLALAACSTPPPPRVTTHAVYKINTALLLASEDGKLTTEQLQAKRDEVVRYLTESGLLGPDDILVSNAAAADRIIRVSIAESGGFKVTIFNPGSTGAFYSSAPRVSGDVRVSVGSDDYWPTYDPWFDQGYYYSPYPAPGYYRYQPRDYLRPYYPRDDLPPVEPRRTPPPPVISDPTPSHPRDRDRNHDGRPDDRNRNHDGRTDKPSRDRGSDWRDRHSPNRPDNNNDRSHDYHPRATPPSPTVTRTEPRHTPEPRETPEPRQSPDRSRDDDRRDGPLPPK